MSLSLSGVVWLCSVQRRERPWMLFRDDGSPHVLVTSMQGGAGKGYANWWTMAQEVRGSAGSATEFEAGQLS